MKDVAKTGWETKPLGEVCKLLNGRAYKKPELLDSGPYPVLRVGNFFTNNHWYYSDLELDEDKYCDDGDLLYAWSASFGPRIWKGGKVIYHYHIWKVLPSDRVDRDFLYYFFDWDKELIKKEQGAGATMIHVSKGSMEARTIPLPPLEEQQRIVAVLDEAFEALARARAHAEANFQNARELFENSLEAELEAVGNSHETSLGEHIDLLAGFAFKSKGYTEDRSAMRLMRGDNIIPGAVRWEGAKYWPIDDCGAYEKFQLRTDDVLIAMDRTWIKAGIKYAVLSDEDVPSLLVQRVARLRCLPSLDTHFLAMLIGSKSFERYVLSIQTGTGVPHISPTQIRDFTFPLPDIETQAKIVERLSIVKSGSNKLADSYSRKLQDTDDLRQSLLQKAFAGELT